MKTLLVGGVFFHANGQTDGQTWWS